MMPEEIDYIALKKRGFLRQRQDGFFVLRTRKLAGLYSQEQLVGLAAIADKYGHGIVHATTRQGLEIPFIRYEDIESVEFELKVFKIESGTSGPRLRPTTVCPGNNWCKQGLIDTFSLARRIEQELGFECGMELPHKFKIAISGCPNACTRPQHSEIGIHGQVEIRGSERKTGYAVYLGGCAGRTPGEGMKLEGCLSEDEVLVVVKRVVNYFKENAKSRQRLKSLIEEAGRDVFLRAVRG